MTDIARAFAVYAHRFGHKKMLVGRDNRQSSPLFRDLIVEALLKSGFDVVDLGTVVSPMFYYASRHLDIGAGMMITASHNGGEYNGCKLLLGDSTIYGDQIQEIRRLVERRLSYLMCPASWRLMISPTTT